MYQVDCYYSEVEFKANSPIRASRRHLLSIKDIVGRFLADYGVGPDRIIVVRRVADPEVRERPLKGYIKALQTSVNRLEALLKIDPTFNEEGELDDLRDILTEAKDAL